jgi:hypothetical protein
MGSIVTQRPTKCFKVHLTRGRMQSCSSGDSDEFIGAHGW